MSRKIAERSASTNHSPPIALAQAAPRVLPIRALNSPELHLIFFTSPPHLHFTSISPSTTTASVTHNYTILAQVDQSDSIFYKNHHHDVIGSAIDLAER
jgi:hypothetical protein